MKYLFTKGMAATLTRVSWALCEEVPGHLMCHYSTMMGMQWLPIEADSGVHWVSQDLSLVISQSQ